jgi:Putative prokaryotic signal transducing protein
MTTASDLVLLERASSTTMAEELQSLLRSEGIEAFLDPCSAEEAVSGEFYLEFGGVEVTVRKSDLPRALKVLAEIRAAARDLEHQLAENGEDE